MILCLELEQDIIQMILSKEKYLILLVPKHQMLQVVRIHMLKVLLQPHLEIIHTQRVPIQLHPEIMHMPKVLIQLQKDTMHMQKERKVLHLDGPHMLKVLHQINMILKQWELIELRCLIDFLLSLHWLLLVTNHMQKVVTVPL